MRAIFLQGFLLWAAHTCTYKECLLWQLTVYSLVCFYTERQHLGSILNHLSCLHTQQLAPGVQPLCTQIQGEYS